MCGAVHRWSGAMSYSTLKLNECFLLRYSHAKIYPTFVQIWIMLKKESFCSISVVGRLVVGAPGTFKGWETMLYDNLEGPA